MVPCAQGRVIVETAREAPPYFATCTSYRRQTAVCSVPMEAVLAGSASGTSSSSATQTDQQSSCSSKGAISKNAMILPHSTAVRPEDLGVTPWYLEDYPVVDPLPVGDRSSYPSFSSHPLDVEVHSGRPDMISTKNSSVDSATPRKAYMDLRDAIALLDETCPNKEPSPSLTPRTPRTPLTPHPRNKRARSKSSDNSSNFSSDRLSDRSVENARPQDKDKKRPFLKKIGISMTEDKPLLAKIAPRIIGKPYLEKIGPSKAVERPFLDKIGSSKTLDKFIFDASRYERKSTEKGKSEALKEEVKRSEPRKVEEPKTQTALMATNRFGTERRRSAKGPLVKMYSFETEDLESTVQPKDNRDPLRGASLDDVLDSGPSSLPMDIANEEPPKIDTKERPANGAELLKCRVTTSEEIISFNSSFGSDKEPNSWSSSPKKRWQLRKDATTPSRRRILQSSHDGRSDDSVPNSPTKRPISNVSSDVPDDLQLASERNVCSPLKTRRQTYEDILERNGKEEEGDKPSKQAQFERRGISSDNLLSKDRLFAVSDYQGKDHVEKTREASSEDYLAHRSGQEYSKETFKQLQDKFKYHEVPMETYADFKKRTRGNLPSLLARQHERVKANPVADSGDEGLVAKGNADSASAKVETESASEGKSETARAQGVTVRSVLKKQQGIDHPSDQEYDLNASIGRPKRRIFQEPSQETMDLLTELRKVKSLLKAPSWEKDLELEKKPARQPKRILLTDKEFCLSVERENSIRRPSRVMSSLETTEEGVPDKAEENGTKSEEKKVEVTESERRAPGPALFEKKCLSLDYADEEKPHKPEARAISLASARNLPSEAEGMVDYSDLALNCDSKSYSSDVFNSPSKDANERESCDEAEIDIPSKTSQNHCAEVDIAIPIDQKVSSPKGRVQIQGRTSDLYEIISPRSTPFRVKKRLGKISVEETVKPESFTLGSKVDCRSTVSQKRTKCFPL